MLFENIKKLCDKHGISMNQLHRDLGFPPIVMYKWDHHAPSVYRVKAVAEYFGVTVDELLR